jgi:hypothetical protein
MRNCTLSDDVQVMKTLAHLIINSQTIVKINLENLTGSSDSFVSTVVFFWFG